MSIPRTDPVVQFHCSMIARIEEFSLSTVCFHFKGSYLVSVLPARFGFVLKQCERILQRQEGAEPESSLQGVNRRYGKWRERITWD